MKTPAQRAAIIAAAKRKAVPFVNRVAARVPPEDLLAGLSRDEVVALAIVLAEATDHARLFAVIAAEDDGHPDPLMRRTALAWAHAEYSRQKRGGGDPQGVLRVLEREYQRACKQAQQERTTA